MVNEEFNLGFADPHDDWGVKVDPDNLNTLRCLNSHLDAEEDYHRDPRRRPRFTFNAVNKKLSPDEFSLERELASHNVRPLDVEKLTSKGISTVGHVRVKGVNSLVQSLGLHASMKYALNNILDQLPKPDAWKRITQNNVTDSFLISLNKHEVNRMPHRWNEGNFAIEIEELERTIKRKGKSEKTFSFRVQIVAFDVDTLLMTLRPDQWVNKDKVSRWAKLLDDTVKGNNITPLHFREAADSYNTFRKSQAVNILINEKTEQAKNLANTIRDADLLPAYARPERGEQLFNPGLNLKQGMDEIDSAGIKTQRKAVSTGLLCPDISLIRGPPGTGKTTVICEIIQHLAVERALRVLMVAPTHTAVDNVLERIGLTDGPNFLPGVYPLRHASNSSAVAPHLRMFTWGELSTGLRNRLADTLEAGLSKSTIHNTISRIQKDWLVQLRKSVRGLDDEGEKRHDIIGHMLKHNVNLVCATTIGISSGEHFAAEGIPFDIAIIDEASKATLGEFLVPGIRAKRWLLVGDEKQLSPHVDQSKIDFILARIIWKHFQWSNNYGKKIWVEQLTTPKKNKRNHQHTEGELSDDENQLTGFFAMNPDVQQMFEKSAVDVRISLEQWFQHRMSNNETLRRSHQWSIFRATLILRADLEDKLSEITYKSSIDKWTETKRLIDDDFIRAISDWERKCISTEAKHQRQLAAHKENLALILAYPDKLQTAKDVFTDEEEAREQKHANNIEQYDLEVEIWEEAEIQTRGKKPKKPKKMKKVQFQTPRKPKEISKPAQYHSPQKPKKSSYPLEPEKPPLSWRRPPRNKPNIRQLYNQQEGTLFNASWDWDNRKMIPLPEGIEPEKARKAHDAIRAWCFEPNNSDNLNRLWTDLVMVADFEYNSGFELLADRLSKNKRQDRIVTLNVQHRMHPKIANFNSTVVYGDEYYSGSRMIERGVPMKLFGTPLNKDDSLILLDTSLFGKDAMEQLDNGVRGKYVNIAEAQVIVEAIDDIANDLASIPHPDERYWEIAIISFYKSQAHAIEKALRVSDVVESSGRKFVDKATKRVRIEVNVVDRFQGREADVVILPMTRANERGSLGFMTVLNRINVATSRARHRLIIVGNARKLEEMGEKYDARNTHEGDEEDEERMTHSAPRNFVSQLINHVQLHGRSMQIEPSDLRNDWSGIQLVKKPKQSKGGWKR